MRAILVVESDPDIRRWVRAVLETAGHRVVAVDESIDAIRWLGWARPAMVVVNARLTDFSAERFIDLVHAREHGDEIPMIVLTTDLSRVPVRGDRFVLRLPASSDELLRLVAMNLGCAGDAVQAPM